MVASIVCWVLQYAAINSGPSAPYNTSIQAMQLAEMLKMQLGREFALYPARKVFTDEGAQESWSI